MSNISKIKTLPEANRDASLALTSKSINLAAQLARSTTKQPTGNASSTLLNIINPDLAAFTRCVRGFQERIVDLVASEFPWPEEQIIADSPKPIPADRLLQARAIFRLFRPDDLVRFESMANEQDQGSWRQASEIEADPHLPSAQVGVTVMQPGVPWPKRVRRFMMIATCGNDLEGDLDEGCVLRWLRDMFHLELVAVVRGQGYMEGLFAPPKREVIESLAEWLPEWGLCEAWSFEPEAAFMTPGITDWPFGELLYLAK